MKTWWIKQNQQNTWARSRSSITWLQNWCSILIKNKPILPPSFLFMYQLSFWSYMSLQMKSQLLMLKNIHCLSIITSKSITAPLHHVTSRRGMLDLPSMCTFFYLLSRSSDRWVLLSYLIAANQGGTMRF